MTLEQVRTSTEAGLSSERIAEIETALVKALPPEIMPVEPEVPDIKLPSICDETGRVIRPAINVTKGTLANGQKISTFYDRTAYDGREDNQVYYDYPDKADLAYQQARREAGL